MKKVKEKMGMKLKDIIASPNFVTGGVRWTLWFEHRTRWRRGIDVVGHSPISLEGKDVESVAREARNFLKAMANK